MYSTPTRIDRIQMQTPTLNFDLLPFDDVSLAFSLGIRAKTLWWLVVKNNLECQERGDGMYKEFKIPKSDGGHRTIHEPYPALKNVQKALLVAYLNPVPVMNCVGAYVPGKSMVVSVKQHVGAKVKVSMDIRDFFGSTRRAWIREIFRAQGFSHEVVKLLSSLVTIPRRFGKEHVVSVLPQGAPTSGAVANLVGMARLDVPIEAVLTDIFGDDAIWAYTRYSDNLEISFDRTLSRQTVDNLIVTLRGIIAQAGYRVRRDKTHVQRHNSKKISMSMLGFTINEKVNIPKQEYRRLRAIVFNCAHKDLSAQVKRYGAQSVEEMVSSLKGRLIYWRQVAPWKIQPLIDQLESYLTMNATN